MGARTIFVVGLVVSFSLTAAEKDVVAKDDRLMLEAVDMTREGKKLTPPTREHPTYYLPVFLGYKERGAVVHYQRKPASAVEIRQHLTRALAKQGYVVAKKELRPTMLIVFEWGSIAPQKRGAAMEDDPNAVIVNADEIREFVLGEGYHGLDMHALHYDELTSLTARHYLLVSAFKYPSPLKDEEVLLWRAHVTTDLWGNYLDEIVDTMITHAAAIAGKEMKPGGSWTPNVPHVTIGTPTVVPEKTR